MVRGSLSYLLDTNIISEPARSPASLLVINQLKRHAKEIAICSIVLHELRYGWLKMADGQRKQAIGQYINEVISTLPCLDYDSAAARVHAEIRSQTEKQGHTLPFVDSQIAAIAIANGLTLVTRNTKDFEAISGIRLENWF